jgi:phosphate acetyltransferase
MPKLQNAKQLLKKEMNQSTEVVFYAGLIEKAKSRQKRIAFPDALDIRVLEAVKTLADQACIIPILMGNTYEIEQFSQEHKIDIKGIEIRDPKKHSTKEHIEAIKGKIKTIDSNEDGMDMLQNPLYFAGIETHLGIVDGTVAGNISTTGEVIRAGIKTVGLPLGVKTVSSFFIMILPESILFYADGAVIPSPTAEQLCDIAGMTASNARSIMNMEPRVAFLSFSTKGSAEHPDIIKVREAFALFTQTYPDILADGELQVDAALIPSIAQRKAPHSPIQGQANILIFPDLDAGNIAYKITERLANAKAIGPIVQGLQKPYCDLSRGCSVQDIVDVSLICSVL